MFTLIKLKCFAHYDHNAYVFIFQEHVNLPVEQRLKIFEIGCHSVR